MAKKPIKDKEPQVEDNQVKEVKAAAPKKFTLPNKKVLVRYVKRQSGYITNPKHVAYGGKLEGAVDNIPAKMSKTGKFVNVLTDIEQEYLENVLGRDKGSMSVYRSEDNFWDTINVRLTKEGITLDLSDPEDYIKYKILLSYDDLISPSITETAFKLTYRYELVSQTDEDELMKKSVDYDRQAYRLLDKIESSKEQLAGLLRVMTGKRVSTESDHDWLVGKVGEELKKNPKRFVEILKDPDYQMKLLIEKAIDNHKIVKMRGLYKTADGIELCEAGQVPTLDNAVAFLNDPKNQDIKLMLKG